MSSTLSDRQPVGLHDLSKMNRVRRFFSPQQRYEPIKGYRDDDNGGLSECGSDDGADLKERPFSRLEYWIFLLLGIAMLWAWNMFLAAAPYFQHRFSSDKVILAHFQSAELSVSTVTNLGSMLVLAMLQKNASYPLRIAIALCINIVCFTVLAFSTLVSASAELYFGFLMLIVFSASTATGLIQNGLFAYVVGFGRSEYTQAIMTGQAVAGVLPPLAEIASVLAVPKESHDASGRPPTESPKSAFVYFLTATFVSVVALLAVPSLVRRRSSTTTTPTVPQYTDDRPNTPKPPTTNLSEASVLITNPLLSSSPSPPIPSTPPTSIPLLTLYHKIPLLSPAVFTIFGVSMISTAFAASTPSLIPESRPTTLFIPIAVLIWNVGDLAGRLLTLSPTLAHLVTHHPAVLLSCSLARILLLPLYLLCNVGGRGAVVQSDAFYLVAVQFVFGISNGYLGSACMMSAGLWVEEEEREATGAFMGLCLVAGLGVGSLVSFFVRGLSPV